MRHWIAGVLVSSFVLVAPLFAQTADPIKLKAAVPEQDARLGTEMDLTSEGRTLAVAEGRRSDRDGAVHVFEWDGAGWIETQVVRPSDPGPGGRLGGLFGAAVAIEGDWMIVGAPEAGTVEQYSGAAYLFERTDAGWVERRKIVGRDAREFTFFGSHVAIDDRTLVIGARNFPAGRREVQVFTFENGEWAGPRFLSLPSNPAALFGAPIAVDGDRILVGASVSSTGGAVHIFERTSSGDWVSDVFVAAPQLSGIAQQGGDLALDGDRFATSNPQRYVFGPEVYSFAVRAYVHRNGIWETEALVDDPEALPGDAFGCAVDLDNELLLVGACQDDEPSFESGALFTYARTSAGYLLIDKRTPDELYAPLNFGEAVVIENGVLAVSAPGDGESAPQSGAVYVYGVPGGGTPRIGGGSR